MPLGIEPGVTAVRQISLPERVVHDYLLLVWIPAHYQAPMASASRGGHRAFVQPAHGNRNASPDLRRDLRQAAILPESRTDAQIAQCCHLGRHVGGVAMALDNRQVLIVWLPPPCQAPGLQGQGRHGARRGVAHPIALAGGAVALAQVRRPHHDHSPRPR